MGDAAEMVLEGIVCQDCGEFIDGVASGYPRNCGCVSPRTARSIKRVVGREREMREHNAHHRNAAKLRKPHACDQCPKLCYTAGGLADHKRRKHGDPANV